MSFAPTLLNWYHQHKRDLPWRSTRDPYIIWLSEVILQQTRVDQGLPYFHRFAEEYPTVADFAQATEDEILRHWQGLGYYSRGRNMHKTALMVMEEHAGYFPKEFEKLIKLTGVGEYTAAAIASFSANEPRAVVDGNVFRFLGRLFGIEEPTNSAKGKKEFTSLANSLLDKSNPATFNQAMMEFGSLQCKPRNPDCARCPFASECVARIQNRVHELPVKKPSKPVKNRYFSYLVLVSDTKVAMQKREARDIWQNLYEFPLIETPDQLDPAHVLQLPSFTMRFGATSILGRTFGPIRQLLSHQKIHAQFLEIQNFEITDSQGLVWVEIADLEMLAQPKIILNFSKKFLNSGTKATICQELTE